MCNGFLNIKNSPSPGYEHVFQFIACEAFLIFPAWHTDLPVLQQCHCTLCGKSNTPRVFQVTQVSYYCVSYPPVYSFALQSVRERETEEGGMRQWQSHDLSHSSGGLCRRLLVPEWEIRERREEAGWGESWSRPQIAPLGATSAVSPPTMVVCWKASGSFFIPGKSSVFIELIVIKKRGGNWCFIKAALMNISTRDLMTVCHLKGVTRIKTHPHTIFPSTLQSVLASSSSLICFLRLQLYCFVSLSPSVRRRHQSCWAIGNFKRGGRKRDFIKLLTLILYNKKKLTTQLVRNLGRLGGKIATVACFIPKSCFCDIKVKPAL